MNIEEPEPRRNGVARVLSNRLRGAVGSEQYWRGFASRTAKETFREKFL
jgi:hypothetical protein